jgi:hypothetical protein
MGIDMSGRRGLPALRVLSVCHERPFARHPPGALKVEQVTPQLGVVEGEAIALLERERIMGRAARPR